MKEVWLLRDGDVLASAELTETPIDRLRGLIGRRTFDGALLLTRTRAVHSAGVRFPLDVAFLDRNLAVVATTTLRPWGLTMPRWGCSSVLEARAGSFERWRLRPGDRIEIRAPS